MVLPVLEEDLKTPLSRKLALASQDKVLELAERGGAALDLEAREPGYKTTDIKMKRRIDHPEKWSPKNQSCATR